jgi:HEAT repeat protein
VSVLSRVFQIQRGEGRTVGLVVGFMFVSVAGLTIGESGISALFFDRIGADSLPLMYLGQGAVGLAGMLVLTGAIGRFERQRAYVALPLMLAGVVAVERVAAATGAAWVYPTMWLTVTVAYLVQAVYLWGTAGLVTDTRRAKRLFPMFAAGNIAGAVAGGLATKPLASAFGAENLLVVWAATLAGASVLCASALDVSRRGRARTGRRRRRPSGLAELREGLAFVRRSRLFVSMSAASVLFSVLFYSLYLPFAQTATARFADADELAGFLGIFWAAVTAVAFLMSTLLTNRLLGRFGAASMILVLSALYAGAFGVLLVTSTFATLVAIRFGVNVWLQGVTSTSWETLTNVAPEHRRDQARAFLNGGPTQIGTAIAGVVQLVGQDALSARQLSGTGLATAGVAIVVAWRIRRSYTSALVDAIRSGRPRIFDDAVTTAPVPVRNDALAVELAIAAMGDTDPRMRRLATELLDSADDDRAAEALRTALRDEDALVREHAVAAVSALGRLSDDDAGWAVDDEDPRVRLAVVRALGDDRTPRELLRDEDASVAAAAAVALLGGPARTEAEETLGRLLAHEDPDRRAVAIGELARADAEDLVRLVLPHAGDPSPAVRAAAIGALVPAGPAIAAPAALDALASPEPVVRDAALAALDRLELHGFEEALRGLVDGRAALAARDGAAAGSIPADGEAALLLRDALLARGRASALIALSASSVTSSERVAMRVALDNLREGETSELANALETIEVAAGTALVRPLLALWESPAAEDRPRAERIPSLDVVAADDDPFIRSCAELVRSRGGEGDDMARSRGSMSTMELVLVLRRIPLFSALAPAELHRVAAIAEEQSFSEGDLLGAEGELGDELHIVLDGTVRVARSDGATIARRGSGEVVGEMSLITRSARMASLFAEGDVRTIRIGHREFEAMVRERPEIALAVMRVLAERLGSASETSPEPG